MRLSGEVVAKKIVDYKDSKSGEAKQIFNIYLKASDPVDGATEVSTPQDVFSTIEDNQSISFDVALGVRSYGTTSRLSVRYLGNLETLNSAKK
jgi:hypothetical protein